MDNSGTVESIAINSLVGEQQKRDGVYKTIETSNNAGSESSILSTEKREELESREIKYSNKQTTGRNVRHNEEQKLQTDKRLEQERKAGRKENARAARRLGEDRLLRSSSWRKEYAWQEKC